MRETLRAFELNEDMLRRIDRLTLNELTGDEIMGENRRPRFRKSNSLDSGLSNSVRISLPSTLNLN